MEGTCQAREMQDDGQTDYRQRPVELIESYRLRYRGAKGTLGIMMTSQEGINGERLRARKLPKAQPVEGTDQTAFAAKVAQLP